MEKNARADIKDASGLKIADDVIGAIAGMAATEIEGVAGMSGSIAGDIAHILGKKNLAKGVKVQVTDTEVVLDLFIIAQYGSKIPDVALNVQENAKRAVESMTSLRVSEVNVHIQGVAIANEGKDEEPRAPRQDA